MKKKLHIASLILISILSPVMFFFMNLYPYLCKQVQRNILDPNYPFYSDNPHYILAPENVKTLWRLHDSIYEGNAARIFVMLLILFALAIVFYLTFDPKKTIFLHTSVEMVCAIYVVGLYLIHLTFSGISSILPDHWNLFYPIQATFTFIGILFLVKQLLAKKRLKVFYVSSLLAMFRKKPEPKKIQKTGDDVVDLKNSLGINGLDAPWITFQGIQL